MIENPVLSTTDWHTFCISITVVNTKACSLFDAIGASKRLLTSIERREK
jgi:hypothetical protein